MLGLSYSDDEDEEQPQQQTQNLQQQTAASGRTAAVGPAAPAAGGAAAVPASVPSTGIVGLAAYADSDEEDEVAATASGTTVPAGSSTAASVVGSASTLSLGSGAPRLTPLRPSASMHSSLAAARGADSAAAGSAAAAGASTAAVPASTARRSASTNDMSALARNNSSGGVGLVDAAAASLHDMADAESAAAAAALHEKVLSLLPPGDPALLSPALAARHQENLSRFAALRARAAAGRPVPTLVQSLQAQQAFHNPYILSRIAAQMQLADRGYGSNLPSSLWREQNLQVSPGVWKDEDDYLTIRKQAEDAAAARIAGRTSIDFVPASSPLTGTAAAGPALSAAAGGAAAPSVVGPPGTTTQLGGHTVATVNADGSITRVRVFDEQPTGSTAGAAATSGTARKSKWDLKAHNPPAPAPAPQAASFKRPPPASDALASESDKRARP